MRSTVFVDNAGPHLVETATSNRALRSRLTRIRVYRELRFNVRALPAHEVESHVFTNRDKIISVAGDEVSADAPRRQCD